MQLSELTSLVVGLKASNFWAGKIVELPPEIQFRVFLLLRKLEAGAKKRKETARDALLAFVEKHGESDENRPDGSQHFNFNEGKASRTRKIASSPTVEKVVALFKSKGLNTDKVILEKVTTTLVVDVSKLEQLVALGQLTTADLEACYEVSHSFNATENKEAKVLLEGLG
jgi:hypothetical protein